MESWATSLATSLLITGSCRTIPVRDQKPTSREKDNKRRRSRDQDVRFQGPRFRTSAPRTDISGSQPNNSNKVRRNTPIADHIAGKNGHKATPAHPYKPKPRYAHPRVLRLLTAQEFLPGAVPKARQQSRRRMAATYYANKRYMGISLIPTTALSNDHVSRGDLIAEASRPRPGVGPAP